MFAAESHTSRHHIAIAAMACLCVLLGGPSYAAGAESLIIAGATYYEPGVSGPGWAWTDADHLEPSGYAGEAIGADGGVIMKGRNQLITKRSDGNWQVKGEGASRASFITTTRSEAIKLGRRICSNQESELIIHRRDGRIRAKDSHGHDPFPPRG